MTWKITPNSRTRPHGPLGREGGGHRDSGALDGSPVCRPADGAGRGTRSARPVPTLAVVTFTRQRQDYFDALAWVSELMTATRPRQLDAPTPCADFTVRDLMGHLLGTAHRGLGTARRVSTRDVPHTVTGVHDGRLAESHLTLVTSIREAWSSLAALDEVTAPWGPSPATGPHSQAWINLVSVGL